jgi:DUF2075 family protein
MRSGLAGELPEVANWYLLPRGDVRSSYALEVCANEYTCQRLELDYVGVCWDSDFLWKPREGEWVARRFTGPAWQKVRQPDMRTWIQNKYRVLLTRARLGTVVWIPRGDEADQTRDPSVFNNIAEAFAFAGVDELRCP